MTAVLDVSAAIEILLQKEKKELFNATYVSGVILFPQQGHGNSPGVQITFTPHL